MTTTTRRLAPVVGLLLLGAAVIVFRPRSFTVVGGGSDGTGSAVAAEVGTVVADLELARLDQRSAIRPVAGRNPFRFGAPRVEDVGQAAPVAQSRSGPPLPSPPPPPPPIPLRFIGFVEEARATPRIAVLSDGRGNVFNAREGDIIEGRYRLLRVGTDSADLAYLDGRGRRTILLSGQ